MHDRRMECTPIHVTVWVSDTTTWALYQQPTPFPTQHTAQQRHAVLFLAVALHVLRGRSGVPQAALEPVVGRDLAGHVGGTVGGGNVPKHVGDTRGADIGKWVAAVARSDDLLDGVGNGALQEVGWDGDRPVGVVGEGVVKVSVERGIHFVQ